MKSSLLFILTIGAILSLTYCNIISAQATYVDTLSPSESSPAFNRELLIDIKGDTIAGYAMIASGATPKETVILVAGYPGNDNNFDIAQEIRRQGKNVIHFNHRGAWGSQGIYSYSNCLEDIDYVISYLSNTDVANDLKIDTQNFTLIGRSFGGGIALIQGSQNPSVKRIIAISSVNYGVIMQGYNTLEELSNFKRYMKKQIMINHDIDDFLQALLDHKKEYNVLTYAEDLAAKDVYIIEDSDKNQDWISQLAQATSIILTSDHNFIDNREELTKMITTWLART